jgi:DNA helicase-2/ATP-dependent DNA helicase PcrA
VKKIPRQISAGESFGASVHNTLKKWGELEEQTSMPSTLVKDQLRLFVEEKSETDQSALSLEHLFHLWHSSFIVEGYATRVEADIARKRGEELMRQFFDWWSREPRTVLAIEKGFKQEILVAEKRVTISGRFDRVEHVGDAVRVIDYKTTSPRTQDEVDADLQLSIYALAAAEAFGRPCTELILLFIGEDEIVERRTTRNASQLKDAVTQIGFLAERIEEGDYHPTPSVPKCTHCPYRTICDASAV